MGTSIVFNSIYLAQVFTTSFDLLCASHLVNVFSCKGVFCQVDSSSFSFTERVLKLMDSDEGAFQDYTGHHDSVDRINFSPNGKQLISASSNSLHIWDITL